MGGNPVVEHIWALLLSTVRYISIEHHNIKSGNPHWQTCLPLGLAGRTLGIIGVGKLGTAVAKVSCGPGDCIVRLLKSCGL
jgi:26S proteasome regulatory subunit N2